MCSHRFVTQLRIIFFIFNEGVSSWQKKLFLSDGAGVFLLMHDICDCPYLKLYYDSSLSNKQSCENPEIHIFMENSALKCVRHSYRDKTLTCGLQNDVTLCSLSLRVLCFTFCQVFAEVHDSCHVTVNRCICMRDGGL